MSNETKFKPQREINKLKSNIRRLEKEKEKTFPVVGRGTYQAFLEGRLKDPALADACQPLRNIDAQIEQASSDIASLQAQVEQIKAMAAQPAVGGCPYCGAPVSAGMRFCGNCGGEMPQPSPQAAGSCPSCGNPLTPGTRFCGECGTPAAPAPTTPAPPPPAAVAPAPAPPPAPAPAAPAVGEASKCPSCGAAMLEDDGVFCGECGAKLQRG